MRSESFSWENVAEGSKTVRDGVEDEIVLSVLLVAEDLDELLGELSDDASLLGDAGVVNYVTPEAEGIEEFLNLEVGLVLELSSPVVLGAALHNWEGLILEFLNELSSQFHGLGSGLTDGNHLLVDLLYYRKLLFIKGVYLAKRKSIFQTGIMRQSFDFVL